MKICKRCRGSGTLLRARLGLPVRSWFKDCTDCGGHGTKPAPRAQKYIPIRKKIKHAS